MRPIILLAALLAGAPAVGTTLSGKVVRVTDGDTITVLDPARIQHRIRLSGIDAPERAQAYGNRSRQHLAHQVFQKTVDLECSKKDRYNREVCTVLLRGDDINLAQVSAGLAWWYRQYAREQSPAQRKAYEAAEQEARDQRRGLWQDSEPTPPWKWRREKKRK